MIKINEKLSFAVRVTILSIICDFRVTLGENMKIGEKIREKKFDLIC